MLVLECVPEELEAGMGDVPRPERQQVLVQELVPEDEEARMGEVPRPEQQQVFVAQPVPDPDLVEECNGARGVPHGR